MKSLTSVFLSHTTKHLSWILRHAALDEGIPIDTAGYVRVSDLLRHSKFEHLGLTDLQEIVLKNDYKRFSLKKEQGEYYIRANQGHTIPVASMQLVEDSALLKPILNPSDFPTVVHCTFQKKWPVIHKRGLFKMRRNHIRNC
jgi:2'-phosphotransferase